MKIPQTFVPEKDLGNKIRELIKKPTNQTSGISESGYNPLDCRIIYNRAKEIAEKLGKLDGVASVYTFEDEKTGIVIEYDPWWAKDQTTHLSIFTKNCTRIPTKNHVHNITKYNMVFEVIQHNISKHQEISLYVPEEWENHLRQICKEVQQ